MKLFFKYVFITIAVVSILFTAAFLFLNFSFEANVNCKTQPVMISDSEDQKSSIHQIQTECDDGRLLETQLVLKNNVENINTILYEAASKKKLTIYTMLKDNGEIDIYIPSFQKKYNETKYISKNNMINFIDLEKDFERIE